MSLKVEQFATPSISQRRMSGRPVQRGNIFPASFRLRQVQQTGTPMPRPQRLQETAPLLPAPTDQLLYSREVRRGVPRKPIKRRFSLIDALLNLG